MTPGTFSLGVPFNGAWAPIMGENPFIGTVRTDHLLISRPTPRWRGNSFSSPVSAGRQLCSGRFSFSRGPPQVCFQLPALPRTGHIRGRHFFSPGQVFSAIEAGRVGLGNRQGLRSQHHLVPYNGRKPVDGHGSTGRRRFSPPTAPRSRQPPHTSRTFSVPSPKFLQVRRRILFSPSFDMLFSGL